LCLSNSDAVFTVDEPRTYQSGATPSLVPVAVWLYVSLTGVAVYWMLYHLWLPR